MHVSQVLALFVLLNLKLLLQFSEASLDVSTIPDNLDVGLSPHLDVNCTFTIDGTSGIAETISLILSREESSDGRNKELAVVTNFSRGSVIARSYETVSAADGLINSRGQSYIHLRWDYPTFDQQGTYRCMATGVDMYGHIIELVNTSIVHAELPDLQDVAQAMEEIKTNRENLEYRLEQAANTTANLQQRVAQMEQEEQMRDPSIFEFPPLRYEDTRYYLSKLPYLDFNESVFICKAYGGKLAEFYHRNEYYAVQDYLKTFSGVTRVFLGVTDAANDGKWIYPSTNDTMFFPDWSTNEPALGDNYNCLCLDADNDWKMYSSFCHMKSPNSQYRYMCEIPDE